MAEKGGGVIMSLIILCSIYYLNDIIYKNIYIYVFGFAKMRFVFMFRQERSLMALLLRKFDLLSATNVCWVQWQTLK